MNHKSHIKDITRILLVEDDLDDVLILKDLMKDEVEISYPYVIDNTKTLQDSLQKLAENKYDIILLDLSLPDSKGLDTFTQINSLHSNIPIVVLTGLNDQNAALETLSAGAQDYMVKGTFNGRAIRRVIRYSIERNELLNQLEQSSEERFRQLIEKDTDGMLVVNHENIVKFVNPAALKILHRTEEELLEKEFPYPILTNSHTEIEITPPNSTPHAVEIRVSEIEWEKETAQLASIHDITETQEIARLKAEIEEKEKLDKLKDNFISVVSHEIKTPLTIIKAALSNLEAGVNGIVSDKQKEVLQASLRNVDRLNRIIKDILDLSRLESGRANVNIRATQLNEIIKEIEPGFTHEAQQNNLEITFKTSPLIPSFQSDPDLIIQVFNNLISNALRFAKKKITLNADLKIDKSGNFIEVTICDDGEGIPPDKTHLLFNKFEQINRPMGGAGYKGTGLGLAISKEIIDILHGKIWVNCPQKNQTEFHFTLPV